MNALDKQGRYWLNQLLNSTHIGVLVVDKNRKNLMVNKHICKMFGYSEDELVGENAEIFHTSHESYLKFAKLAFDLVLNGKSVSIDYQFMKKDGTLFWIHIAGDAVEGYDEVLWTMVDVTKEIELKNKLLQQTGKLQYKATHDELTSLPNRFLFHDRVEEAIKTAKRNKSKMALLFIDLDCFKAINDIYGHKEGDEVLKVTANRLRKIVRENDTVARLGGDEFTVILNDLKEVKHASIVAQKIVNSLSEGIVYNEVELFVSASIGIASYPEDGSSLDELLSKSDHAMYDAKAKGKNNFQFYTVK